MPRLAVTLALTAAAIAGLSAGTVELHAQAITQQYGKKQTSTGPRAIGLVQITPKGKARIIPVAIMMDGKFFDAGSYKATPVPMALDFGVVYEGFRTGVSQGVFTITQPGQLNHNWIAEGTWLPAGAKAPETSKKYATPVIEDKDAPPVLHRHKDSSDTKDEPKPDTPPPAPKETPKAPEPEPKKAASDENITDPNRPVLRRGKPDASAHHEPFVNFDDPVEAAKATKDAAASLPPVQTVAAISDAAGPDPRPYTYDLKPAEEAIYRNKMLELAATQLQPKAQPAAPGSKKPSPAKTAKPMFDDLTMHVFDLSNSNEPVLVLSAKTRPPAAPATGRIEEPQEITLIARTNLEGEVQKLFFAKTDSKHLEVSPRMELIDAVDADGDGRGELLFRRTSSEGSSYAIYRVTADQLWPLFEGTP